MIHNAGVPYLSREKIEQTASKVIAWIAVERLERPSETPVAHIIERLVKEQRLLFKCDADLGHSRRGRKILGAFDFSARSIFIDPVLVDAKRTARFRFTLAHELGHFVLHRRRMLDWPALDAAPSRVDDDRVELHFLKRRSRIRTPRQWLEWQANYFASCLLMPAATVQQAIADLQGEAGVTRRLGRLYLDDQPTNRVMYQKALYRLQDTYQVSRSVVVIRLRELALVDDRRTFGAQHIARLFSEEGETTGSSQTS